MSPDSFSRQYVQAALRTNLPFICIASIVLIAGIASLLLAAVRPRDRLLLWMGTFSTLYGARLFLENDLIHAASGLSDITMHTWTRCITSLIAIPYALFARELYGAGWKKSLSIWLWLEVAYAVTTIPMILLHSRLDAVQLANDTLVIAGTLVLLFHLIFYRKSATPFTAGLTWPLATFGIFVLLKNQDFRPYGLDVEPFGFLILLAGLGFTASRFALARDRQLVEVEQELKMATQIQNSLIPASAPDLPGLHLATRYQPMTAVAGDFFDFLQTGDRAVTVLVADVSGHGVPAALVSSTLKVSFAAQQEQAHDPAKILSGLNRMLRGSLGGQYVTASCAAIDLATQTVTYAGAGHPPALLLRKREGKIVELSENGLFIGPFPSATYSNMTAPFESGDKLLLYTDGILEATGPEGEEFGQANLQRLLVEEQASDPFNFIAKLFERISGPTQQDDLTAVLVQFR